MKKRKANISLSPCLMLPVCLWLYIADMMLSPLPLLSTCRRLRDTLTSNERMSQRVRAARTMLDAVTPRPQSLWTIHAFTRLASGRRLAVRVGWFNCAFMTVYVEPAVLGVEHFARLVAFDTALDDVGELVEEARVWLIAFLRRFTLLPRESYEAHTTRVMTEAGHFVFAAERQRKRDPTPVPSVRTEWQTDVSLRSTCWLFAHYLPRFGHILAGQEFQEWAGMTRYETDRFKLIEGGSFDAEFLKKKAPPLPPGQRRVHRP